MPNPIQLVLESIASFNSLFLDALARAAREKPRDFPLPMTLVGKLAQLNTADCRQIGSVSLCLGDAHFSDPFVWTRQDPGICATSGSASNSHWITASDRVTLAHSLFLVAWHGVHSMPSFTRVLFGMSHEVHRIFQQTSFATLFSLAEARSSWLYPRWQTRRDVWSSLLDAPAGEGGPVPSATLRLLQVSAVDSVPMLSTAFLGGLQVDVLEAQGPNRSDSTDRAQGIETPRRTR